MGIVTCPSYDADILAAIRQVWRDAAIPDLTGTRVVVKPNLVDFLQGHPSFTHPRVLRAMIRVAREQGAREIIVAEGPSFRRDAQAIVHATGVAEVLGQEQVSFVDLNYDDWYTAPNAGGKTNLQSFVFPATLRQTDWIVSMPKLKTHHWVGITASMKNLFGTMPGSFYGWPKNVLHNAGIVESIIDINVTLRPHFAIVDGIVGMEGDGPIMGTAKNAGVIVMGRNLPAVDATCARLMGINPSKIVYLAAAENKLGPIRESLITQRGEPWKSVRTDFLLLDYIDAHRGLRL